MVGFCSGRTNVPTLARRDARGEAPRSSVVAQAKRIPYRPYVVQPGETVYDIATKHDVTMGSVLSLNSLSFSNPNIYEGQVIRLPVALPSPEKDQQRDATAAAAAPPAAAAPQAAPPATQARKLQLSMPAVRAPPMPKPSSEQLLGGGIVAAALVAAAAFGAGRTRAPDDDSAPGWRRGAAPGGDAGDDGGADTVRRLRSKVDAVRSKVAGSVAGLKKERAPAAERTKGDLAAQRDVDAGDEVSAARTPTESGSNFQYPPYYRAGPASAPAPTPAPRAKSPPSTSTPEPAAPAPSAAVREQPRAAAPAPAAAAPGVRPPPPLPRGPRCCSSRHATRRCRCQRPSRTSCRPRRSSSAPASRRRRRSSARWRPRRASCQARPPSSRRRSRRRRRARGPRRPRPRRGGGSASSWGRGGRACAARWTWCFGRRTGSSGCCSSRSSTCERAAAPPPGVSGAAAPGSGPWSPQGSLAAPLPCAAAGRPGRRARGGPLEHVCRADGDRRRRPQRRGRP
ncbi:unnamed protein product [Pedinophyceae sp. YPF-701]|nr:unnamed protein product [Pedinophyceae sp. YPF-701]